jgi:hypothetical protein
MQCNPVVKRCHPVRGSSALDVQLTAHAFIAVITGNTHGGPLRFAASYAQAGSNSQRFIGPLRLRSEQLRQGLGLKEWTISAPTAADPAAPPVLPR